MHRLFQIQRPGKGIPQASLHKDADMPRMPTTGFWRVPVGTRMVEWLAVAASEGQPIGFMKGEALIPDDFDRMGEDEILALFEGKN